LFGVLQASVPLSVVLAPVPARVGRAVFWFGLACALL